MLHIFKNHTKESFDFSVYPNGAVFLFKTKGFAFEVVKKGKYIETIAQFRNTKDAVRFAITEAKVTLKDLLQLFWSSQSDNCPIDAKEQERQYGLWYEFIDSLVGLSLKV